MSEDPPGLFGRIAASAVTFTVLTYLVAIALGLAIVTFSQFAAQLEAVKIHFFTGALFVYPIITSIPINLLLLTDFCLIVYIACFVAAFRSRDGFMNSLRKLRITGRVNFRSNWLVSMPLASCALLLVVLATTLLLARSGLPSGTLCNPCPPEAELYALLGYSPISEEIAFRITTLGLLVAMIVLLKKYEPIRRASPTPVRSLSGGISSSPGPRRAVRRSIKSIIGAFSLIGLSLLVPESAKNRVGIATISEKGWRGLHWIEWIFLILTSSWFGLAHVVARGSSWEFGKAFTAAVSGFALGIAYLAFGAYAAILLHWFFDFYFESFSVGTDAFGGAVGTLPGLISLTVFIVGGIGTVMTLSWLVRIARRQSPTAYIPPEASQ